MDALRKIGIMALTVGVLDVGWLTLRNGYHQSLFKAVQGSAIEPRWIPALMIYLLIPVALYVWADGKTLQDSARKGAIVGLLLYAFYDLTNYATLKGWTLDMTLTDIAWGTVVCTAGASAGYALTSLYANH